MVYRGNWETMPQESQVAQVDVAELQARLAEALRGQDQLREQLAAFQKQDEKKGDCLFLTKVPREIREEIYKLLLVNEVLGTPHAVRDSHLSSFRRETVVEKYDLHPSILRICRKISEEGYAILYGSNTFFFDCRVIHFDSPIMREWQGRSYRFRDYGDIK